MKVDRESDVTTAIDLTACQWCSPSFSISGLKDLPNAWDIRAKYYTFFYFTKYGKYAK